MGLPLAAFIPPRCRVTGMDRELLPRPRLLAEERSSFSSSSSSSLPEPAGNFVASSPWAVSVADCSGDTQRGRGKGRQGKRGAEGPRRDQPGTAHGHTSCSPSRIPTPVTFTKRPYNMPPALPALRGFLLLILTPCSESLFTETPSCGRERAAKGSGAFCLGGSTPLPPRCC